jgi:hypothetical protein
MKLWLSPQSNIIIVHIPTEKPDAHVKQTEIKLKQKLFSFISDYFTCEMKLKQNTWKNS